MSRAAPHGSIFGDSAGAKSRPSPQIKNLRRRNYGDPRFSAREYVSLLANRYCYGPYADGGGICAG